MSIALNELRVQNSIASGEKLIVAGATAEVQIDYDVLARAIVEQWSGSTLAGSSQSVKSAIDAAQTTSETLNTNIAELQTRISQIANGSPTPVETKAEMTEETSVYLYVGDEEGESTGYWYSYDSTEEDFVPRGEYGGAVTSTTFNQHGVPADDFAVGEALDGLDDRLTTLESGGSGMSSTAKALLISLLRKALYSSEQSADISALEVALETGDSVAVTGVSVSPTTGSIVYGESTLTIKATVTPSNATNKAVTWASSNENVATVSANGVVSAAGTGTATITATTIDGGFTATCTVTVSVENLIVENDITRGAYISRETGSANTSESFDATDYMWLKPNTTYYAEGPYMENFYAFYNSGKTFVTSPPSGVTVTYENDRNGRRSRKGTITTGANGYYFRASIDVDCHYTPYVSLVPLV